MQLARFSSGFILFSVLLLMLLANFMLMALLEYSLSLQRQLQQKQYKAQALQLAKIQLKHAQHAMIAHLAVPADVTVLAEPPLTKHCYQFTVRKTQQHASAEIQARYCLISTDNRLHWILHNWRDV